MNYLYNGVELPYLDEVWTDELRSQYPYATIVQREFTGFYYLYFSPQPFKEIALFLTCVNVREYLYSNSTQTWDYRKDYENIQHAWGRGSSVDYACIWTNGDICEGGINDTEYGKIRFSASYPTDTKTGEQVDIYDPKYTPTLPTEPIDPTSLLMGYRVGQLIRGMR